MHTQILLAIPSWMPSGWAVLDWAGTKWLFLVLALVMPLASLLTWAERRQSAMMQDRLGPNRANIGPIKLKGILHFVADALKMIFKEDFIPANVHKGLFALAPWETIAPGSSVPVMRNAPISDSPIATSYDIICDELRSPPSSAHLL